MRSVTRVNDADAQAALARWFARGVALSMAWGPSLIASATHSPRPPTLCVAPG